MEKLMELLLNAENVRMVMLMVLGYCGYVKLNTSLLKAIDEKIDLKLAAFHTQLKTNDFAHLNEDIVYLKDSIKTLTFMLEKNKFLEKEDKEFIDKRLDR